MDTTKTERKISVGDGRKLRHGETMERKTVKKKINCFKKDGEHGLWCLDFVFMVMKRGEVC